MLFNYNYLNISFYFFQKQIAFATPFVRTEPNDPNLFGVIAHAWLNALICQLSYVKIVRFVSLFYSFLYSYFYILHNLYTTQFVNMCLLNLVEKIPVIHLN